MHLDPFVLLLLIEYKGELLPAETFLSLWSLSSGCICSVRNWIDQTTHLKYFCQTLPLFVGRSLSSTHRIICHFSKGCALG